jgi:hypothetical protein
VKSYKNYKTLKENEKEKQRLKEKENYKGH